MMMSEEQEIIRAIVVGSEKNVNSDVIQVDELDIDALENELECEEENEQQANATRAHSHSTIMNENSHESTGKEAACGFRSLNKSRSVHLALSNATKPSPWPNHATRHTSLSSDYTNTQPESFDEAVESEYDANEEHSSSIMHMPESIPYIKNGEINYVHPLPKKRSDTHYDLPRFDHDGLQNLTGISRYLGICFCKEGGFNHILPNGMDLWVNYPECTWGRSCPFKSQYIRMHEEERVPRDYIKALHEEQTWMAARAVAIENYFTMCSEISDQCALHERQKKYNARMKEIDNLRIKKNQEIQQLLLQKRLSDHMKRAKQKRMKARQAMENRKRQKQMMKQEAKIQRAKAKKVEAQKQKKRKQSQVPMDKEEKKNSILNFFQKV